MFLKLNQWEEQRDLLFNQLLKEQIQVSQDLPFLSYLQA